MYVNHMCMHENQVACQLTLPVYTVSCCEIILPRVFGNSTTRWCSGRVLTTQLIDWQTSDEM